MTDPVARGVALHQRLSAVLLDWLAEVAHPVPGLTAEEYLHRDMLPACRIAEIVCAEFAAKARRIVGAFETAGANVEAATILLDLARIVDNFAPRADSESA